MNFRNQKLIDDNMDQQSIYDFETFTQAIALTNSKTMNYINGRQFVKVKSGYRKNMNILLTMITLMSEDLRFRPNTKFVLLILGSGDGLVIHKLAPFFEWITFICVDGCNFDITIAPNIRNSLTKMKNVILVNRNIYPDDITVKPEDRVLFAGTKDQIDIDIHDRLYVVNDIRSGSLEGAEKTDQVNREWEDLIRQDMRDAVLISKRLFPDAVINKFRPVFTDVYKDKTSDELNAIDEIHHLRGKLLFRPFSACNSAEISLLSTFSEVWNPSLAKYYSSYICDQVHYHSLTLKMYPLPTNLTQQQAFSARSNNGDPAAIAALWSASNDHCSWSVKCEENMLRLLHSNGVDKRIISALRDTLHSFCLKTWSDGSGQ